MQRYQIIFCTTPSAECAEEISQRLIKSELAACCSTMPGISSIYRWEGKIEKASEFLMMIKTRKKCFNDIERIINEIHPYSTPEIIAVPVTAGSEKYLSWIKAETGNSNG